jgi:hypothetical protein
MQRGESAPCFCASDHLLALYGKSVCMWDFSYSNTIFMGEVMKLASVLLLLLGLSFDASANFKSGTDLSMLSFAYDRVNAGRANHVDYQDASTLMGYIQGVHDIGTDYRAICSPPSATAGQIAEVVIKYLRAHPEKLHLGGEVLISQALREAFPCKK